MVIPPIYGLRGVGFETFTGDGPISYWNSYVGVGQMGGRGNFIDPRIQLFIRQTPDLVTPKLAALLDYQRRLQPPPPAGSVDHAAAARGRRLFSQRGSVQFLNPAYAERSATRKYRTTPLRGLQQHPPYFHDGSAPDLRAVVEHYDALFGLQLTENEKLDLIEYLKSL